MQDFSKPMTAAADRYLDILEEKLRKAYREYMNKGVIPPRHADIKGGFIQTDRVFLSKEVCPSYIFAPSPHIYCHWKIESNGNTYQQVVLANTPL